MAGDVELPMTPVAEEAEDAAHVGRRMSTPRVPHPPDGIRGAINVARFVHNVRVATREEIDQQIAERIEAEPDADDEEFPLTRRPQAKAKAAAPPAGTRRKGGRGGGKVGQRAAVS